MKTKTETAETEETTELNKCTCTAEQELARLGARIDKLIARASKAKVAVHEGLEELQHKGKTASKRGEAALHELKDGLDKAWDDLQHTWKDLKHGTERAVKELKHEDKAEESNEERPLKFPVPCKSPRHKMEEDPDLNLIV